MIGTKPRASELQGIISSKNRRLSNSVQVLSDEVLFYETEQETWSDGARQCARRVETRGER